MTHVFRFSLILFILVAGFSPSSAKATLLNSGLEITDGYKNSQNLPSKGTTTDTNNNIVYESGIASGLLAPKTKITFLYSLTVGGGPIENITGGGGFTSGTDTTFKVSPLSIQTSRLGQSMIYTYYNLTMTLSNLGSLPASFTTYLSSTTPRFQSGYPRADIQASAVPLPAALPLFGAGIAGMAGLKRLRNRKKTA